MTYPYSQVSTLADAFRVVIAQWLTADQRADVDARNAKLDDFYCETHDYCDANMAMDAAWNALGLPEMDAASQAHADLWNAAWSLAKRRGFSTLEAIPTDDIDPPTECIDCERSFGPGNGCRCDEDVPDDADRCPACGVVVEDCRCPGRDIDGR